MSRVLDELRRDHRNMAKILAIVEGQARLLREGRIADLDLVERAMDYSLSYPDLCHHPKEDLVFERVAARDPSARASVDRLVAEHRELATLTRRLAEVVHQVALDEQVPRDRLVAAAESYVELTRRHIREEEAELFPLAERRLSAADWDEIDAAAAKRPDPLFGGGIEERYLALHQRIMQLSD